jgi:hypothetical protein
MLRQSGTTVATTVTMMLFISQVGKPGMPSTVM